MIKPLSSIITAAALLVGCAGNPIETAKIAVAEQIPFSEEMQYRNLQTFSRNVVCGEYRVIQRWGDHSPYRNFIYRDGLADENPSSADVAIYCSEDRYASLTREFGIGISEDNTPDLLRIAADLRAIHTALEAFYTDTGIYPETRHGLAVLAGKEKHDDLRLRKAREGGYLERLPTDPWGNLYHYAAPEFAGSRQAPRLHSLGADGQPGGEGENADIGLEHLEYLEYLLDQ